MRGPIKTNGRTMGLGFALALVLVTPVDLFCQTHDLTLPGQIYAAVGVLITWWMAAKTGPRNEEA